MLKISDLLKTPSLKYSYIVAGHRGIFNTVKKLDIMEEPYPMVLEFLVANEFLLTNFWSMKHDKIGRIDLVKNMIERHCACLGIMPDLHLNGIIDSEIIELANKNNFPIIYIDSNARWCDIVYEYGVLSHSSMMPSFDTEFENVLNSFSDFYDNKDCQKFCNKISDILNVPIIMSTSIVFSSNIDDLNVSQVVSKIYSLKINDAKYISSPITISISDDYIALIYFGVKAFFAACIPNNLLHSPILNLFNKIAPTVTKELDRLCLYANNNSKKSVTTLVDVPMFYVLIKKDNIKNIEQEIKFKYIIFEKNIYLNYCIMLIPKALVEIDNIYDVYYNLMQKIQPDLFIFSVTSFNKRELVNEIGPLKYMVNTLSYLEGIYSTDELPLLYILLYAPYEYKSHLFKSFNNEKKIGEEEKVFLDTLRLYAVVRNMVDVARLLGIHSNSVKYRLTKALKQLGYDDDRMLGDISSLKLLIQLELIMIEN